MTVKVEVKGATAHSNVLPIAIAQGFLGTIPMGLESLSKSERFKAF